MTLRLPATLVSWFRGVPAPIDAIQPPVDDLVELRRLKALTEIHRCKVENVVFFDFTKKRRDTLARVDRDGDAMSEPHVHDCTGPNMTCPCGFVFRVARFCLSLNVYDNDSKKTLLEEGFNSDSLDVVINALQQAVEALKRLKAKGRQP